MTQTQQQQQQQPTKKDASGVKQQQETVYHKREQHPDEPKYPSRSTYETQKAFRELLTNFDQYQLQQFRDGELIVDEQETAELFDEFEVGDVIGLILFHKQGPISHKMKITEIDSENDMFYAQDQILDDVQHEVYFEDVSVALEAGHAQILWKNEKPYGVDEYEQWNVTIISPDDGEDDKNGNQSQQNASASSGDEQQQQEEEYEYSRESVLPGLLKFEDVYFAFTKFEKEPVVVMNPKEVWDNEKVWDDRSPCDMLAVNKMGLFKVESENEDKDTHCMYTFDPKFTENQLRRRLKDLGAEENEEMVQ